jgi:reverse transcriptase-like protein
MDRIFKNQRGRNLDVYVDDSIMKSKTENEMVVDLQETFDNMRKYNMRLNPRKCVFGIKSGKFLGFIVSERGIDANPENVQAVIDLAEPTDRHGIMQLTGRMAALSRFISKAAERVMPFSTVLKGNKSFEWGEVQSKAIQVLKDHLHSLPTLARPVIGETLY